VLTDDAPVVDVQPDHDPEGRIAGEDDRVRVAGALAGLPWRLREVIVLRDIYDLPHRTIATELGISEAAAKVRLHRARRRLREALVGEMGDGRGRRSERDAASAGGADRRARDEPGRAVDARAS
jgi:RNA polymerase sigma-70 factor (ECF subfamily)